MKNIFIILFVIIISFLAPIACEISDTDNSKDNSSDDDNISNDDTSDLSTFSDISLKTVFGDSIADIIQRTTVVDIPYQVVKYNQVTSSAGATDADIIVKSTGEGTVPTGNADNSVVALSGSINYVSAYTSAMLVHNKSIQRLSIVDRKIETTVVTLETGNNYMVILLYTNNSTVGRSVIVNVVCRRDDTGREELPVATVHLYWESDGLNTTNSAFHWEDLNLTVKGVVDLNGLPINEVSKNNKTVNTADWSMKMVRESGYYKDPANISLGIYPGGGPELISVYKGAVSSYFQAAVSEGESGSINNLKAAGKKWVQVIVYKDQKEYEYYKWKIESITSLKIGTESVNSVTKVLSGNCYIPIN